MRVDEKSGILSKLKNAQELFTIVSPFTKLPFVVCDPETYDDEVLLFETEGDARREGERLRREKNPVQIVKVEKKDFLRFYMSLYPMGVNCLLVNSALPSQAAVQLSDLLRRNPPEQRPKGAMQVENPELYLTAVYFIQELRRHPGERQMPEEAKELHEEMMAHFSKGRYLIPVQPNQNLVVLKEKDGQAFQPVFTDYQEFEKSNQGKKFRPAVIEAGKLIEMASKGKMGIAVNPFTVNVRFQVTPKKEQSV